MPFFTSLACFSALSLHRTNTPLALFAVVIQWRAVIVYWLVLCVVAAATPVRIRVTADFCRRAPFCHLILQLDFVSEARWRPVLPSCSQGSWRAATRRSRGREVKAMDLKSIGVSPRRFEPCRLRVAFALSL